MVVEHGFRFARAVIDLHSVLGESTRYGDKGLFGLGLQLSGRVRKDDDNEVVEKTSNGEREM